MRADLTPHKIIDYLNQYVIGQQDAKKSVAVALRNRWRSRQLALDIAKEISPKNILLIGPTGVGKTEIARRIAALTDAPFVKVEATKYTEIGYVGRDVESMVRDLVEESVRMIKKQESLAHGEKADEQAVLKIADILWPTKKEETRSPMDIIFGEKKEEKPKSPEEEIQRAAFIEKIRAGEMDDRIIEIDVAVKNNMGENGDNENIIQIRQVFASMMPKKTKKKTVTVRMARELLREEVTDELLDMDTIADKAIHIAEENGIIFIDEIDKIASKEGSGGRGEVSREGVQRDILPIVEGATVKTKYGSIKTDHILFIAAGAFHVSKPSNLIPELQGRFPIRVELHSLSVDDLRKILTEPRQALIRQYTALLEADGVQVTFSEDALVAIAEIANEVNSETEDIGARRLYTILERVLEQLSYDVPELPISSVVIDEAYVREKLGRITENMDISNYIL